MESWIADSDNEYIGRRNDNLSLPDSHWKNPFTVKEFGIDLCLQKYEDHIRGDQNLLDRVHELKDKKLLCYCELSMGYKCHGQVLLKLLAEL